MNRTSYSTQVTAAHLLARTVVPASVFDLARAAQVELAKAKVYAVVRPKFSKRAGCLFREKALSSLPRCQRRAAAKLNRLLAAGWWTET